VFGEGGSASRGMALVRRAIAETRHGTDVSIEDASGDECAQLAFVDDAVDMTLRVLDAPSPRHFVYNVAGPDRNYMSLREYHALIAELFPGSGRVQFKGSARSLGRVDTSRIRRESGCPAGVAVCEGLKRMFASDLANP
jgi:nucleoside-diphosphate-sugar epimerase